MIHTLRRLRASLAQLKPLSLLVLGYGAYIMMGWLLLSLPLCWESEWIAPLDNLFIATSAVSTTGLITVDTPNAYSFWGELVILLLFQIGGLGYMTFGSCIILARKHKLPPLRERIGQVAFTLPEGFELAIFLRHVVIFTVIAEALGIGGLYLAFDAAGLDEPLWPAIFHAISAFCTAGFSIFSNSLEDFRANVWVNAIVATLSILGAIGFLVMSDIWRSLISPNRRTTLTTRIILRTTGTLLLVGWVLLFLIEPALQQLAPYDRVLTAGFQAMTALTTVGFNTYPIGALAAAPTLLLIVWMLIGASPSGTGGGIKSTSISAVWATMWSTLHGRSQVTFRGHRVPNHRLFTAVAALVFYLFMFCLGTSLLLLVETHPFEDVLFEAASALGTVGLSRGITGDLTPMGKVLVITLMFIGRVGPLSFGLALFSQDAADVPDSAEVEDLAV